MLRRDAKGKRERYSVSVDWFSLGCVIYEFIYGGSPFRTERAKRWGNFPKLEKADKGKAIDLAIQEMEPEFNDLFDSQSRDLISKLLIKDPKRRLGARGFKEIMRHPWFSSIDFDTLNIIPAPSQPSKDLNIATQSEIGAFEDNKSQKKSSLTEEDHRVYTKWPFVNEQAFQEEIVEFLCYEELNVSI
jgi:serine/threonine protein kinase